MSALNMVDAWKDDAGKFFAPKSAQEYLRPATAVDSSCGSSCGAGDEQPKPSACGAGDGK